jgi:hypothetical protein
VTAPGLSYMTQPESEEVRPERFLKNGKPNPDIRDSVSAFGKVILFKHTMCHERICPGQFMARLFLNVVRRTSLQSDGLGNKVLSKSNSNTETKSVGNVHHNYYWTFQSSLPKYSSTNACFLRFIGHPPSPPSWAVSVANSRAREKM